MMRCFCFIEATYKHSFIGSQKLRRTRESSSTHALNWPYGIIIVCIVMKKNDMRR